jgi:hypothetical protein
MTEHDEVMRDRVCRAATDAWKRLREGQTWGDWMQIGEAFLIGRQIAFEESATNSIDDPRYKRSFGAWMSKYGLDGLHRSDRAKLFTVMESRGAIEDWRRASLTERQRLALNHPTSVLRKWQAATDTSKTKKPRRVVGIEKVNKDTGRAQHEIEALQEQVKELEAARDTEDAGLFGGTPTSVAKTIVKNMNAKAAALVAEEILKLLTPKPPTKGKKAKAPKKSAAVKEEE